MNQQKQIHLTRKPVKKIGQINIKLEHDRNSPTIAAGLQIGGSQIIPLAQKHSATSATG